MIWIAVIVFILAGGWLSRMCGGGPPKLRWGLDQWIYALPYYLICLSVLIGYAVYPLAILAYLFAVLGKRTGHGGGMDLASNNKEPNNGRSAEKLEYLILWLHGRIPQYWYDALLLAITGLAVTLVAGLVVMMFDPFLGLVLALSGITKAPAYMIGRLIYPNGRGHGIPYLNEATAIGEFLTGVFAYAILAIVAIGV